MTETVKDQKKDDVVISSAKLNEILSRLDEVETKYSELRKSTKKDEVFSPENMGTSGSIRVFNDKIVVNTTMKGSYVKNGEVVPLQNIICTSRGFRVNDQNIKLTYSDKTFDIVPYKLYSDTISKRPCTILRAEGDQEYHEPSGTMKFIQNDNLYFICEYEGKEYKVHHSAIN